MKCELSAAVGQEFPGLASAMKGISMENEKNELLIKLYEHKMALYKLLDQYGYTLKRNGIESFCNYSHQPAEEAAYKALNIESDQIFKSDFYKKWDEDEQYLFELKGITNHHPYHLEAYEYLIKKPLWKSIL